MSNLTLDWFEAQDPDQLEVIRTRGRLKPRSREISAESVSLDELIRELRDQVRSLPLCFVIYSAQADRVAAFYEELRPTLEHSDAVWVASTSAADALPSAENVVILNLEDAEDRKLYRTLGADLAFFWVAGPPDVAEIGEWARRANTIALGGTNNRDLVAAVQRAVRHDYRPTYLQTASGWLAQ
jgi:hypothetical protein